MLVETECNYRFQNHWKKDFDRRIHSAQVKISRGPLNRKPAVYTVQCLMSEGRTGKPKMATLTEEEAKRIAHCYLEIVAIRDAILRRQEPK